MKAQDNQSQIDLAGRARIEALEAGFIPGFEAEVNRQVEDLKPGNLNDAKVKDLRQLLWSSIDNDDSRDLDQIEYAERLDNGNVRVMIGIADVDFYVHKSTPVDVHASKNTTSIYLDVVNFPMLPEKLSYDLSSLLNDQDRRAIVIDLEIDPEGAVANGDVYPALVRNKAKLAYNMVGDWLINGGTAPEKIASVPGIAEQLLLQSEIKERIHTARKKQGSLSLQTIEATARVDAGTIVDLDIIEANLARDLIENFMIAGNIAITHFLESKKMVSLRRVVRTPERWERIVELAAGYGYDLPNDPDARALASFLIERQQADELHFPDLSLAVVKLIGRGEYSVDVPGQPDPGHFALAVHDYTHGTAPNRRFPDLVTQRLIKAACDGNASPYNLDELEEIAAHCTQRENDAKKLERKMRKIGACALLSKHIGQVYDGVVTGAKAEGTYVRIFKPPVEGRIVSGEHGLDVGDQVKVRLVATDADRAYIDFAAVKGHR